MLRLRYIYIVVLTNNNKYFIYFDIKEQVIMVESRALSKARLMVDKSGTKEILINNEIFVKLCSEIEIFKNIPNLLSMLGSLNDANSAPVAPFVFILWALYEKDIENEHPVRTFEEYFGDIFTHENAAKRMEFFYYNFNVKKYDIHMIMEDKRKIMENSIIHFEKYFEGMLQDEEYKEYQEGLDNPDRYKDHRTYKYILDGLKKKINYKNEYLDTFEEIYLNNILDSLSNISFNFYTENFNGVKIYPLVVDMLSDMFTAEYFWYLDKPTIKNIIKGWSSTVRSQEKRKIHKYVFFEKMKLIQKVQYDSLRMYFLSEYARTLNVDKEELRKFFQHIFYFNVDNHEDVPKLEFDIIDQIPLRPYMLEETKMVIGGI